MKLLMLNLDGFHPDNDWIYEDNSECVDNNGKVSTKAMCNLITIL